MLAAAGATIAVQVGAYAAARALLAPSTAAVTALLLALLWVIVATPIFAAGGTGLWGAVFHGGPVLDASAVLLIVLTVGKMLSPAGAAKIYLIWCSVGLFACGLVVLARRVENRLLAASLAILIVLAIAAGPFWANGIILAGDGPWRGRVSLLVAAANPVYATASCLPSRSGFIWHEGPILYDCTVLARDVPKPKADWLTTAAGYAAVAGCLFAVALIRRRR